jgi:hypothetical protein
MEALLITLGLIAMAGREGPDRGPSRPGHHYQNIHIHDRAQLGDTFHISEFMPGAQGAW